MNRIAPINQIPPEILTLVPDFWDADHRDKDLIALTHVCRAWREVFVSRPTLWTDLKCVDLDKTRVYLERSESSPINLSLDGDNAVPSSPFLEVLSGATMRLKSLDIEMPPRGLQPISSYLTRPAPLLRVLSIRGCGNPRLPPALFKWDLSSLHELRLRDVPTELPRRNMVNLMSFALAYGSPPISVT